MARPVFGGGHIDLAALIPALAGTPLQAEIEETFTPSDGAAPMRCVGSIAIDRNARVRTEVREGDGPTIAFVIDPVTRVVSAGVVGSPEEWGQMPWPFEMCSAGGGGFRGALRDEGIEADAVIDGIPCQRWEFVDRAGARTTSWRAVRLPALIVQAEHADSAGVRTYRLYNVRQDDPDMDGR